MLVTGERSNTIKAFLGFSIFFLFLDFLELNLNYFFLIITLFISLIIAKSDFLKNRYIGQLYNNFIFENRNYFFLDNNVYIKKLYKSGFSVLNTIIYLELAQKIIE